MRSNIDKTQPRPKTLNEAIDSCPATIKIKPPSKASSFTKLILMPKLLERVISQLDTLVPYLSLAHNEVFDLVATKYDDWCQTSEETPFPNTFEAFTTQIAHSAFVLGFSYTDAFLADLIREIYTTHPNMLPQNKKLSFETIVAARDYESVVLRMVDHEVHETMHKGMADIAKYFEDRFSILWPEADLEKIVTASLVRNCVIHNNAVADHRLSNRPDWNLGDQIALSVSDVHSFGISARSVARHLFVEADARHLSRSPGGRDGFTARE